MKTQLKIVAASVLSVAALGLSACGGDTDTDASPDQSPSEGPSESPSPTPADEAFVLAVEACDAFALASAGAFRDDEILQKEINAAVGFEWPSSDVMPAQENWKIFVLPELHKDAAKIAARAALLDPRWTELSDSATGIATNTGGAGVEIYCDAAWALAERD